MNLNRYVGLPWKDGGRGPDGYDCYGIVVLAYREILGINLPSFASDYVTTQDRKAIADVIAGRMGPWKPLVDGEERVLDAVLMTEGGVARHIGLVAAPGFVLHMVPLKDSVVEPYTTGKLRHRIAGFYRHEANT